MIGGDVRRKEDRGGVKRAIIRKVLGQPFEERFPLTRLGGVRGGLIRFFEKMP